jgi:hypothetical protein
MSVAVPIKWLHLMPHQGYRGEHLVVMGFGRDSHSTFVLRRR